MFPYCCLKRNKNERSEENEEHNEENRAGKQTKRPTSASQVYTEIHEPQQVNTTHKNSDNDMQIKKTFEEKDNDMRATIKQLEKQIQEGNNEITKMKKAMETKQSKHHQLKQKQSQQEHRIQQLENENSNLLTRISAIASAKLTDGNPNIADLSDENRPTKLAEQFSELYDNEWTDALDVLKASGDVSEEEACHILLKALSDIYIACAERADKDSKEVEEATLAFLGGTTPPVEVMKQLKDQRKKNIGSHVKLLKQDTKATIKMLFPDKTIRKEKATKKFLRTCLNLCWCMAVQDPPVFIDVHIVGQNGEEFDKKTLRPYTKSGHYIDFIVWPPLYLHKGGNLLGKGVAQGTSKKSDERSESLPEKQQGKRTKKKKSKKGGEVSEQEESKLEKSQHAAETSMVDKINTNNSNGQNECMNKSNIDHLSSTNLNSVDNASSPRNEDESEHTERMEIQQSKDNHGKELEKHTEQQVHVTDGKDLKEDTCKTTRSLTDDKDPEGGNNKRESDVESGTFQDTGTSSINENIEHHETKELDDRLAPSLHSNEQTSSSDLEKLISETENNTEITESKTGQDDDKTDKIISDIHADI